MLEQLSISSEVSELLGRYFASPQGRALFRGLPEAMQEEIHQLAAQERVSYQIWWRVLDKLQLASSRPALGLEIAGFVALEDFGCLGYLFKTSQNLSQAVDGFIRYQRLLYDGNQACLRPCMELNVQNAGTDSHDLSQLEIVWSTDYGYSNQISDELLLAGLLRMMNELTPGHNLSPLQIDFPHRLLGDNAQVYTQYFGCEVKFNQPRLRLMFKGELLDLPLAEADPVLHQLMQQQADLLLSQMPAVEHIQDNLLFHIQSVLLSLMQQGEPNASEVAQKLNMSLRTLHRRLKDEHQLLFRDVLRQTRMNLARQLLSDQHLPLSEIALMLGYSEQSAFSRAFRQWFGTSPYEYRQE